MNRDSRIYVAGHRGLAGAAIVRALRSNGYTNLLLRTHSELELTDREAVDNFFDSEKPEYVFLAAARVGGILANATYPADFLRDNLAIELNVIDASYRHGVQKLQFLGSSCIYPKLATQPMREDALLTGPLEPTNDAYAIAKIAGIRLCQAYRQQYGFKAISLMPTNLYGPGDNFNLANSHVLPALIQKVHNAEQEGAPSVTVWGSGAPLREFLHADDLASAAVFLMENYDEPEIVNVGSGEEISIADLVRLVMRVIGYRGKVTFDSSKPDGTPRKLLDVSRLNRLGWHYKIDLESGIRSTYEWFLSHQGEQSLVRH